MYIVQVISCKDLIVFFGLYDGSNRMEVGINSISIHLVRHHLNGHYVVFLTTCWMLDEDPFQRTGKLTVSDLFIQRTIKKILIIT